MIVKQIKYNITKKKRSVDDIKYIVVHDTGNKDRGSNAEAHYIYFNGDDRKSSADYFVDSNVTFQVNNPLENYTWHCGDGHGRFGILNENSIGVEMCINEDGNFEKTLYNTIILVKNLTTVYKNAIIKRHYDASRKICPAKLSYNNWEGWTKFKDTILSIKETICEHEKEIIQQFCQFSDPSGVWKICDTHVYAKALYEKWAKSYK